MFPSLQTIQNAHLRIGPYIHRTPILTSQAINQRAGAEIYFKCENFQKIGAFKARGGINAVLSLSAQDMAKGLTTHSSGNHAQALAYAAKTTGSQAFIVMPNNAPAVKIAAVKEYGATVILCQPREDTVQEVIAKTGATFIHPYNNDAVIAGQATAAKELIEDSPFVFDYLLTPVGGGGLLSGTALITNYLSPKTKVIAGEPEGAADAILSFKSGQIEAAPYINTIADGLLTTLGDKTLPIIRQYVTDIRLVNDQEIIAAMRLIWERLKIIIEPSCAVPLAVVLKYPSEFAGQKIGIILSGGNVDLGKLPF
jgi:threonine dehydratase